MASITTYGQPLHTHFVSIIASEEEIEEVKRFTDTKKVSVWVSVIDKEMTVCSYIVPGLGCGRFSFWQQIAIISN